VPTGCLSTVTVTSRCRGAGAADECCPTSECSSYLVEGYIGMIWLVRLDMISLAELSGGFEIGSRNFLSGP